MTNTSTSTLRTIATAEWGTDKLLDAVEAACDSGDPVMLAACEARWAADLARIAELVCKPDRPYTRRSDERFHRDALDRWPGNRASVQCKDEAA